MHMNNGKKIYVQLSQDIFWAFFFFKVLNKEINKKEMKTSGTYVNIS